MGLCHSKNNKNDAYHDFCKLRVSTLYADLDESINKKKKIIGIVEYFMDKYFDYNIDIICIQGINGINIIIELIDAFKKKINEYNDKIIGHKNIYLNFYPDIEIQTNNSYYMSTCEYNKDSKYCNKLIVSKHPFLQTSNIEICCKDNMNKHSLSSSSYFDKSPKTKLSNNDSDENINIRKYMQLVNVNVDGTIVSVYNVELEPDSTGISNIKERRLQLHNIINHVMINKENLMDDNMRKFVYDDMTYIATNRDIHIITGMFHINEIKNGTLNQEYIKMNKILNSLDINRWIKCLRNNDENTVSNIKLTKDVYTFLISKDIIDIHDISNKSQKLFEKHKTVIISSNIIKNSINMNKFTYYPEDTVLMIYKPNILINNNINSITKFIDNVHYENITKKKVYFDNNKYIELSNKKNNVINSMKNNKFNDKINNNNNIFNNINEKIKNKTIDIIDTINLDNTIDVIDTNNLDNTIDIIDTNNLDNTIDIIDTNNLDNTIDIIDTNNYTDRIINNKSTDTMINNKSTDTMINNKSTDTMINNNCTNNNSTDTMINNNSTNNNSTDTMINNNYTNNKSTDTMINNNYTNNKSTDTIINNNSTDTMINNNSTDIVYNTINQYYSSDEEEVNDEINKIIDLYYNKTIQ